MTGIEQWDALQHAVRVDCQNLRSLLLVLWSAVGFAVAFPSHVRDREQMRVLLKQFGANMPPFPGLYDDDAEARPCADCTSAHTLRARVFLLSVRCAAFSVRG
jgi:hypothetical protein